MPSPLPSPSSLTTEYQRDREGWGRGASDKSGYTASKNINLMSGGEMAHEVSDKSDMADLISI